MNTQAKLAVGRERKVYPLISLLTNLSFLPFSRKLTSVKMMWDDLPIEVCYDILSRLPVKTLIRCTVLSKFFRNLIINPSFITAHLSRIDNKHLLLREVPYSGKNEVYMIERDDEDTFSGFRNEGFTAPLNTNNGRRGWNVLGSINGVICLIDDLDYEGTSFLLWNPCIRKVVELPGPLYSFCEYGAYHSASGFGFDQSKNDYKVVRIVHLDPDFGEDWSIPMVEVYSLRSGCWKSLGDGLDYQIRRDRRTYTSCFVHGCIHWVGYSCREEPGKNVILKFDVSSETFGVIEVPSCVEEIEPLCGGYIPNLMVKECSGMLALILRHIESSRGLLSRYFGNFADHVDEQVRCSVWVLKEYDVVDSWTKVFNFDGLDSLAPFGFVFRNNGEIIVAKDSYETKCTSNFALVCIDQKRGETLIRRLTGQGPSLYMSAYQESMVLMQEGQSYPMLEDPEEESD